MEGEEKREKGGIWAEFIRKRNSGYFDFIGEETSEVEPKEQSGCCCCDNQNMSPEPKVKEIRNRKQ